MWLSRQNLPSWAAFLITMKIGIIHFCGIQRDYRHLIKESDLQIAKDENPLFFQNLNNFGANNTSAYLLNILEIKDYWPQIIKELKNFCSNNDVVICINQNNAQHIPSCLGNNVFKKLFTFQSEWASKFAIQFDYGDYFKRRMEEIVEKIA